jgi:hypothetical protein
MTNLAFTVAIRQDEDREGQWFRRKEDGLPVGEQPHTLLIVGHRDVDGVVARAEVVVPFGPFVYDNVLHPGQRAAQACRHKRISI